MHSRDGGGYQGHQRDERGNRSGPYPSSSYPYGDSYSGGDGGGYAGHRGGDRGGPSHWDQDRGRDDRPRPAFSEFDRERLEKPSRTLFVRNLKYDVSEAEIRQEFEKFGDIKHLFSLAGRRGICFVTYPASTSCTQTHGFEKELFSPLFDIRCADKAKQTMQGAVLAGRTIDVHYSIPKEGDEPPLSEDPDDDPNNNGNIYVKVRETNEQFTSDEMRQFLSQFGEVKDVREPKSDSFAKFVEFYDTRASLAAIKACKNGMVFKSGKIFATYAYPPGRDKNGAPQGGRTAGRDRGHSPPRYAPDPYVRRGGHDDGLRDRDRDYGSTRDHRSSSRARSDYYDERDRRHDEPYYPGPSRDRDGRDWDRYDPDRSYQSDRGSGAPQTSQMSTIQRMIQNEAIPSYGSSSGLMPPSGPVGHSAASPGISLSAILGNLQAQSAAQQSNMPPQISNVPPMQGYYPGMIPGAISGLPQHPLVPQPQPPGPPMPQGQSQPYPHNQQYYPPQPQQHAPMMIQQMPPAQPAAATGAQNAVLNQMSQLAQYLQQSQQRRGLAPGPQSNMAPQMNPTGAPYPSPHTPSGPYTSAPYGVMPGPAGPPATRPPPNAGGVYPQHGGYY